jgi:hypothetical protein
MRVEIDRAIVAGDSLRKIATTFATDKDAVRRHKLGCITRVPGAIVPVALVPVPAYQTPAEVAITQQTARSVASRAESLVTRMETAFNECQGTGDYDVLVKCAKEVREGLRLLAQLSGELSPNQTNVMVNNIAPSLMQSPEWPVLMAVLAHHPEVHAELMAALTEAGL